MIQRLPLSPVQSLLWERIKADEVRVLQMMLVELGANVSDPWQFDHNTRTFWMNTPDPDPPQEPNADAESSSS